MGGGPAGRTARGNAGDDRIEVPRVQRHPRRSPQRPRAKHPTARHRHLNDRQPVVSGHGAGPMRRLNQLAGLRPEVDHAGVLDPLAVGIQCRHLHLGAARRDRNLVSRSCQDELPTRVRSFSLSPVIAGRPLCGQPTLRVVPAGQTAHGREEAGLAGTRKGPSRGPFS